MVVQLYCFCMLFIYLADACGWYTCRTTSGGGCKGRNECLTAFVMGDRAKALSAQPNDAAIFICLQELQQMYGDVVLRSFERGHVEDWSKNPFVRGAYSYPRKGNGGQAGRIFMQQPFCNEVCNRIDVL